MPGKFKLLSGIKALVALGVIVAVSWMVLHQRSTKELDENDQVLARVNELVITRSDFVSEMERRGGNLPGQYQTVAQRRALLDAIVERKAMLLAAEKAGYAKDPVIVEQFENMMVQKVNHDLLEQHLSAVSVSDAEVEAYYQAHKQEYARPARRQVALIQVTLPKNAQPETLEKAKSKVEQALAQVSELDTKIAHFGAVARKYSDDRGSRYRGGVIGWLIDHPSQTYRWDEAVMHAAFALENPGDLSDIIQTADGFYLLRLVRTEPERAQQLDQLQAGIANRLQLEKRKQEKVRVLAELQDGLNITVNEQMLEQIQPISGPVKLSANSKPPAMP